MTADRILRPLERRVLQLVDDGVADVEIARRFGRSPGMIGRIVTMAGLPCAGGRPVPGRMGLRPLERRVLHWRGRGAAYTDIGPRLRRSPAAVERIEVFARYKLEHQARTAL